MVQINNLNRGNKMKKILIATAFLLALTVQAQAARVAQTVTADGTYCFQPLSTPSAWSPYKMTIFADGTFGSGTIAWNLYNGSGYQVLKDLTGTAVTSTSDDSFNVDLGFSQNNPAKVCAVLSGATNPSIVIGMYDNN